MVRSQRRWILVALGLILVAAALVYFLRDTGQGGRRIILITLDTTRADRLGCYGHSAAHTPALDRLAREGVLFRDVTAPSPTTLPSHASILTGRFPPSHGARNNGNYILRPEETSLAEVLQASDVPTAAFIAADVLSARYGLDQGFGHYDDDLMAGAQPLIRGVYRQLPADRMMKKALAWLEPRREGEFFAWIHLFDPHSPYEPHSEFPVRERSDSALYDSEVAFMDHWIGTLLENLEAWGILDDTIIIAVGDHGEALGEHGEDTHGLFVYQSTLAVPMMLRAPGRVPAGTEVSDPVGIVDLMPTLLELLDLPLPAGVEGRSLVSQMNGERETQPRPLYFETFLPRIEYMWASLRGMRIGKEKYIQAPIAELYDLALDPAEKANLLAAARSAETATWKARFADLESRLASSAGEARVELDPDSAAAMRALGYGFAPIQVGDDDSLPDPKARVHLNGHYRSIQDAWRAKDYARVAQLTGAAATANSMDLYQASFHARALVKLKRHSEAERLFDRLLERLPDDPLCTRELAAIYSETRRLDKAVRTFQRAIDLEPMNAIGHSGLGDALQRQGSKAKARAAWERALELKPYYPSPANNIGILEAEAGHLEKAAEWFERVLRIDPAYARAAQNLQKTVQQCERENRWPLLRAVAEKRLEMSPNDSVWRFYRALALARLGDRGEALRIYQELLRRPNLQAGLRERVRQEMGR